MASNCIEMWIIKSWLDVKMCCYKILLQCYKNIYNSTKLANIQEYLKTACVWYMILSNLNRPEMWDNGYA